MKKKNHQSCTTLHTSYSEDDHHGIYPWITCNRFICQVDAWYSGTYPRNCRNIEEPLNKGYTRQKIISIASTNLSPEIEIPLLSQGVGSTTDIQWEKNQYKHHNKSSKHQTSNKPNYVGRCHFQFFNTLQGKHNMSTRRRCGVIDK